MTVAVEKPSAEEVEEIFVTLEEVLPDVAKWQNGAFKGNKSIVDLLGEPAQELKIDRVERKIYTHGDIWVEYLYFDTDDAAIVESSMIVSIKDVGGKTKEIPLSHFTGSDNRRYPVARIKSFVKEIRFKSEAVRFRRPRIKKIMINGFSIDKFKLISEKIAESIKLKESIDEIRQSTLEKLHATEEKIVQRNADLSVLEVNLEGLTEQSFQLEADIDSAQATINSVTERVDLLQKREVALEGSIQKLSEESKLLNKKIAQEEQSIKTLENNKNVFSDEFVDYVKASKSHIRLYACLALLPLAVIAGCSGALFLNAKDFLHRGNYSLVEVLSDFLLRIPFAAVSLSIAYLAWKIAESLIGKCVEIHQAQRDLSKILVVAKETVFSSANDLDISDDVKFKERIGLKVQLIRSHLGKEISDSFEYQASLNEEEPSLEEGEGSEN